MKKIIMTCVLLFLASCTFSQTSEDTALITQEKIEVTNTSTEENVNYLIQLEEQFFEYDQKYNPLILLNTAFISDPIIEEMNEEQTLLTTTLTTLREEGISEEALTKTTTYEQCISAIAKYNKYIELVGEEDVLFDVKGTQENLVDYYFWAAEYDKAKSALSRVKESITDIKEVQKAQNVLGIAVIPPEVINSWDDDYNAKILYEHYISSYENQGYTDTTIEKEEAYFKELAKAVAPDEEFNQKETHNQVQEWYNKNVKVCVE